jgi:hypothetical protein
MAVNPVGVITGFGFGPVSTKDQPLADTFFAVRRYSHLRLPSVGAPAWGIRMQLSMGPRDTCNRCQWWRPTLAPCLRCCPSFSGSRRCATFCAGPGPLETPAQGTLALTDHGYRGGSAGLERSHALPHPQGTGRFHPPGTTPRGRERLLEPPEAQPTLERPSDRLGFCGLERGDRPRAGPRWAPQGYGPAHWLCLDHRQRGPQGRWDRGQTARPRAQGARRGGGRLAFLLCPLVGGALPGLAPLGRDTCSTPASRAAGWGFSGEVRLDEPGLTGVETADDVIGRQLTRHLATERGVMRQRGATRGASHRQACPGVQLDGAKRTAQQTPWASASATRLARFVLGARPRPHDKRRPEPLLLLPAALHVGAAVVALPPRQAKRLCAAPGDDILGGRLYAPGARAQRAAQHLRGPRPAFFLRRVGAVPAATPERVCASVEAALQEPRRPGPPPASRARPLVPPVVWPHAPRQRGRGPARVCRDSSPRG